MSIDKDQASETVLKEIFRETIQQIEIDARRGGQRPLEIEVMIRISQPEERCKERTRFESRSHAADDLTEQQAIREYRQMFSMLFERRDRNDNRNIVRNS